MTVHISWHQGPLLLMDTESSGLDTDHDRIVTCTLIGIQPGHEPHLGQWLIDPGIEIPAPAAAVHGITTSHARDHGQAPAVALEQITTWLARAITRDIPLVLFNAQYDLTLLDRELRRHQIPGTAGMLDDATVIDGFVIDKQLDRRKGSRKLTDQAKHYGLPTFAAHDATADALTAGRLAWALAYRYPAELQIPLPDLHAKQKQWKAAQARSFRAYLQRSGKDASDVHEEWPVRPLPPGWDPAATPTAQETPA